MQDSEDVDESALRSPRIERSLFGCPVILCHCMLYNNCPGPVLLLLLLLLLLRDAGNGRGIGRQSFRETKLLSEKLGLPLSRLEVGWSCVQS